MPDNLRDARPDKPFYYLEIAKAVSTRSTCLNKHYGAVIVKNDEIISTGYNGAPRGKTNCIDVGSCYRIRNNIPRGTMYERCGSVHAEANAIISAARDKMLYSTMYVYGWDMSRNTLVKDPDSCMMCKRFIINAGIERVVFADADGIAYQERYGYGYRIRMVEDWVEEVDAAFVEEVDGY